MLGIVSAIAHLPPLWCRHFQLTCDVLVNEWNYYPFLHNSEVHLMVVLVIAENIGVDMEQDSSCKLKIFCFANTLIEQLVQYIY